MKTATKALVSESALCADCGCPGIGKRIGGGHVLPTRRSRNSFRLSFLLRRNENNGIMARIKQPKEEWREIPGYEGLYKAIAMPFAILLMLFLDWEEMLETKLKVRPYDPD